MKGCNEPGSLSEVKVLVVSAVSAAAQPQVRRSSQGDTLAARPGRRISPGRLRTGQDVKGVDARAVSSLGLGQRV